MEKFKEISKRTENNSFQIENLSEISSDNTRSYKNDNLVSDYYDH